MLIENADFVILTDFMQATHWLRTAGAYRIATEVRKAGYTCQVIDCFTAFDEVEKYALFKKIIGNKTLAVGFSSTFFANIDESDKQMNPNRVMDLGYAGPSRNYPFNPGTMKKYFDFIKNINPKIKFVLGGGKTIHLEAPGTDALITGMGDLAIVEYLKYLENKNPFFQFKSGPAPGQIIIAGDTHNAKFDFQNSRIQYVPEDNMLPGETLVIEVGRGCIFKCGFCAFPLNGKKKNDYIKDVSVVKEELIRNYNEYGTTKYFYTDDTHNDNIVKLRALADMAQSLPFKLEYAAYLRIDLIRAHPEQYILLKDGGLKGAFFGIESLHHPTLKAIGKGLHPDKVVEELYLFEQKMPHVGTQGSFIAGLPHETKETLSTWMERVLDKSFPLDTYYIETLSLNRNPQKLYRSEFEQNFEQYYTFRGNSTTLWNNGNFDSFWAWEFCKDTYRKVNEQHRARVGGWTGMILNNLGITDDLVKKPVLELGIDWRGAKAKIQEEYKRKVFS